MAGLSPDDAGLEVWGGIEATIVRIGNRWRDQVRETGHADRIEDLDRIAALGIKALRYPILWESVAPETLSEQQWAWHDARLGRLRDLGVRVIAGLVHHGSGPHYTDLLDPLFPEKLAQYAAAVAERYPWIESFTPVNEPLTTARFSALYGHWYPHHSRQASFLRALLNQCRGIVLAMEAVRRVTPQAQLIQTEDLGRTFSTPILGYQADFENERRWLSYDLLCGLIDTVHPLYKMLLQNGVTSRELAFFQERARPPDILGMNHYLTSERFLDERLRLYPAHSRGGNGRHRYADVEAVRMDLPPGTIGPKARLRELWERYRRPVAVTEVHHGCTREEQLRWLAESWQAASALKREGADIRALTVWALLGVVDWNSLLLRQHGFYEAGAYDVRSEPPRPTVLHAATAALARGEAFDHPVLDVPGWWRRPERHYVKPAKGASAPHSRARPVLITRAGGKLGRLLARLCALRGLPCVALDRQELNPADPEAVAAFAGRHRPWAILDARSDLETTPRTDDPEAVLDAGQAVLAEVARSGDIGFLAFSAPHLVARDGNAPERGGRPLQVEHDFAARFPRALVLQLPTASSDTLWQTEAVMEDEPPELRNWGNAALDLLIDGEQGLWRHAPEPGRKSGGLAILWTRAEGNST